MKRHHFILQGRYGVFCSFQGARENPSGMWIHQYFLLSFIVEEFWQTLERVPTRAQWKPPTMLDERPGFTWDTFVCHITDGGVPVDDITKPKHRHVFQWRGHK